MHKILTASLLTLLISGCASVPQWSNDPQDCNDKAGKYSEGYQRHLQMGLQKQCPVNISALMQQRR